MALQLRASSALFSGPCTVSRNAHRCAIDVVCSSLDEAVNKGAPRRVRISTWLYRRLVTNELPSPP